MSRVLVTFLLSAAMVVICVNFFIGGVNDSDTNVGNTLNEKHDIYQERVNSNYQVEEK